MDRGNEKGPVIANPEEPEPLVAKGKKKNAPRTRAEILGDVLANKYFNITTMVFTIYALFADDIRLMATQKPADVWFYAFSVIALIIFMAEFGLVPIPKRKYVC